EVLAAMSAAPGAGWRAIPADGADAAFAIALRSEPAPGVVMVGELRAARRGDLLALWGLLGAADSATAPAKPAGAAFLGSFAFGERGLYLDEKNAFRVQVPAGWEPMSSD